MQPDCIFCKIANKEIKTEFVLEDDEYVVFNDINAQAPVHMLIIPKKHFESLNDVDDYILMGKLLEGAKKAAQLKGLKDYRIVLNTGKEAGQAVFHIHFHILGGRQMLWPPG